MKVFVVLSAVLVVALAAEVIYPTKYHNTNLYEILRSERLLKAFLKCLMDEGTCTAEALELKSLIPNFLDNGCQKCTEYQREDAKTVMKYLIQNKHDMWQQLKQKYDPTGIYQKKYAEEAHKNGITF